MITNVNTYNGLLQAIQQWVNRNDDQFISNIPLFISLAEQQFFYDCSTLGNEAYVTGTFNANNGTVPKPAMWGQTLTFSFIDASNNIHVLERVSYEYIRTLDPNKQTTPLGNLPQYYTDYGFNYFLISPTPISNFTYEIAYFQKVEPLSINNQTNWITQYAYDALFYACLDKAYRFIDNLNDANAYASLYQERIAAINDYNKGRKSDRTGNTMKD